jgi:glycosyltransferase involved in cell wall biosynthesis
MLVSILINNYNNAPYLDFCLQSAMNQSYKNKEIIVYDDGSTDNSMEILQKYADKITILSTGKNFGVAQNFNQGNAISEAFKVAKGEIICLLDGDDAFLPEKVACVVAAFQANPKATMVQHVFHEINHKAEKTAIIRPKLRLLKENYLQFILKTHCLIGLFASTSALSFRRTAFEKMMPYPRQDEWTTVWADVRLSREACFLGEIVTLHEPLGLFRVHTSNHSAIWYRDKQYRTDFLVQSYGYFNKLSKKYFTQIEISYKKYRIKKLFNPIFWW